MNLFTSHRADVHLLVRVSVSPIPSFSTKLNSVPCHLRLEIPSIDPQAITHSFGVFVSFGNWNHCDLVIERQTSPPSSSLRGNALVRHFRFDGSQRRRLERLSVVSASCFLCVRLLWRGGEESTKCREHTTGTLLVGSTMGGCGGASRSGGEVSVTCPSVVTTVSDATLSASGGLAGFSLSESVIVLSSWLSRLGVE